MTASMHWQQIDFDSAPWAQASMKHHPLWEQLFKGMFTLFELAYAGQSIDVCYCLSRDRSYAKYDMQDCKIGSFLGMFLYRWNVPDCKIIINLLGYTLLQVHFKRSYLSYLSTSKVFKIENYNLTIMNKICI